MNHKEAITAALTLLCEDSNRQLTRELVETYAIGLEGIDPIKIVDAAKRSIQQDRSFMPRAGQLRAMCLTPIHGGQSPERWGVSTHRDASDKYISLLDSVPADRMLAAIEAVSKKHAGNESMTRELALMEKNIRKQATDCHP